MDFLPNFVFLLALWSVASKLEFLQIGFKAFDLQRGIQVTVILIRLAFEAFRVALLADCMGFFVEITSITI